MAKRAAIRREEEGAESAFLKLVPGSRCSNNCRLGDVIVPVDGTDHYVEIKHCDSKGESINQVRAIKFIPCVIFAPRRACWYILSADQLVRLAASKARGQHTELAFECMLFTLNSLASTSFSKATDAELDDTLRVAIRCGVSATGLRELMTALLADITTMKKQYIELVRRMDH